MADDIIFLPPTRTDLAELRDVKYARSANDGQVLTRSDADHAWVPRDAPGGSGSGDKYYQHTQAVAASRWVIVHGFGRHANVVCFENGTTEIGGGVSHPDLNTTWVDFAIAGQPAALSGTADCT